MAPGKEQDFFLGMHAVGFFHTVRVMMIKSSHNSSMKISLPLYVQYIEIFKSETEFGESMDLSISTRF